MNLTLTSRRKAKGNVLVLTALALFLIMGMAGLAIDLSHAYANKTRLQNALDATALSAARTLHRTKSTAQAETEAENTFNLFLNSTDSNGDKPNQELIDEGVTTGDITFYYSDALNKNLSAWTTTWTGAAAPRFVTARYADASDRFATWFMRVLAVLLPNPTLQNFTLTAIATAAAHPIVNCNNWPVMMCSKPVPPSTAADEDCKYDVNGNPDGDSNNKCFGYDMYSKICIKQGAGSNAACDALPGGHFMLIDLPGYTGKADIRELLAGQPVACLLDEIENATGNAVGPVRQGINTRFQWISVAGLDSNTYPPDHVTMELPVVSSGITPTGPTSLFPDTLAPTTSGYRQYRYIYDNKASYTGGVYQTSTPDSLNIKRDNRRTVVVPVADCSTGDPGSSGSYEKKGFACMFLNKPAQGTGNTQFIFAEIYGDCSGQGEFNDQVQSDSVDFVLYQSPYQ